MLMALLSGILSALTLPTSFEFHGRLIQLPSLGWLSWFTLIPFYLALRSKKGSGAKKGLVWALGYYSVSLYWLFIAMHRHGGVSSVGSFLGTIVVVFLLALFMSVLGWISGFLMKRDISLIFVFPLLWVVQDFVRNYLPFGGFPWANLGYTQASFLKILQIIDLTGIYGVTFLIVLVNAVLAEIYLTIRGRAFFPLGYLLVTMSLFLGALSYGFLKKDFYSTEDLSVALIQGNISQEDKWAEDKIEENVQHLIQMTEKNSSEKTDLVLWPEAAFPSVMPPEVTTVEVLKKLKSPLLMGVVTYQGEIPENWPPEPNESSFKLYNAAALIMPGGLPVGWHYKTHLVPMGEYVPLSKFLFFLHQIVPSISSFTAGEDLHLLVLKKNEQESPFGVTICYEDLFPEISRTMTRQGAQFLVNLTNDAWYERSSAVFQHFDFSRFRAIENGRFLLRVTNTGVTAVFDPMGRIVAMAPAFEDAAIEAKITLQHHRTFYTRFGDVFAWLCVGSVALLLFIGMNTKQSFHLPLNPKIS